MEFFACALLLCLSLTAVPRARAFTYLREKLDAKRNHRATQLHITHTDAMAMDAEWPLRDIYVFAGQSNAEGMAMLRDLPAEFADPPEHVFTWRTINGTEWRPYSAMSDNGFNYFDSFGPEVSFIRQLARHYEQAHESFGVMKVAKLSASLNREWARQGWQRFASNSSVMDYIRTRLTADLENVFEDRLNVMSDAMQEPHPLLFSILVDSVRSAMKSPQCFGGRCRVKALIWVQGEADSKNASDAAVYRQNLHELVDIVRQQWESPEMFVAVSQLAPFHYWMPKAQSIREAQQRFVDEEGPRLAGLVSSRGLHDQGDHLHYNAEGYIELGMRAAELVKTSLGL